MSKIKQMSLAFGMIKAGTPEAAIAIAKMKAEVRLAIKEGETHSFRITVRPANTKPVLSRLLNNLRDDDSILRCRTSDRRRPVRGRW
jgi:hypothetical protein